MNFESDMFFRWINFERDRRKVKFAREKERNSNGCPFIDWSIYQQKIKHIELKDVELDRKGSVNDQVKLNLKTSRNERTISS